MHSPSTPCAIAHDAAPLCPVEGVRHPLIKRIRALSSAAGRASEGRYLVDGAELVDRALCFGAPVEALVWSADAAARPELAPLRARAAGLPNHVASPGLLGHALRFRPIPEVIAIVTRRTQPLSALLARETLLPMLERPANPSNLGMFVRSAEAAGLTGLAVVGPGADPFDRRALRASRGGLFRLTPCAHAEPEQALAQARQAGHQIVATSANRGVPFVQIDYRAPTVVLIGNEHTGLPAALADQADAIARVPMLGRVNSLNVAIAGTLVLYEALRQRALSEPRDRSCPTWTSGSTSSAPMPTSRS